MELTSAGAGRATAVVLGASNVSRGLARLSATVRARAPGPVDLVVAAGHGRAYGVNSRVWMRRLPSILGCGLWRTLAERGGDGPTAGLVTDVGNELLYGLEVAEVAAAVRESVRRLAGHGATIVITGLPLASIATVGRVRYRALRSLFVPGCRLSLAALKDASRRLDDELRGIADSSGAAFLEQPGEWYGLDAIHVRRCRIDALWDRVVDAWGWPRAERRPRASFGEWAAVGTKAAEVRSIARIVLRTPQPAWRSRQGLRLWLY